MKCSIRIIAIFLLEVRSVDVTIYDAAASLLSGDVRWQVESMALALCNP